MSTKTIIVGGPEKRPKLKPIEFEQKPIEFEQILMDRMGLAAATVEPSEFRYIELICRNYNEANDAGDQIDLMFAYDDPSKRSNGILIFGRWNDGIVA